jgi:P2-related tail formation protein
MMKRHERPLPLPINHLRQPAQVVVDLLGLVSIERHAQAWQRDQENTTKHREQSALPVICRRVLDIGNTSRYNQRPSERG